MEQEQIVMIKDDDDEEQGDGFVQEELPQVTNWDGTNLYLYQGFWLGPLTLPGLVPFRKHFQALHSDVVLATFPKSGTTWLKALAFSIINRTHYSPSRDNKAHPLLSYNPHDLVPFFEILYRNNPSPVLDHPRHPVTRIFSTHLPHKLLPACITRDDSHHTPRIIYMCRNPLDQFISSYHFYHKVMLQTRPQHDKGDDHGALELLDEAFDLFCRGIQRAGPSLDNHLEYWKASVERPDKVMFIKFEDLKEDTVGCVKRVAEFLGCPFSQEEEKGGVVGDIVRLCSFESMRDLDVNKSGTLEDFGFGNSCFFRKGEVGDWVNYFTPSMVERVQTLVEEKFDGSALTFNFNKV